jgi:hypothetical protein
MATFGHPLNCAGGPSHGEGPHRLHGGSQTRVGLAAIASATFVTPRVPHRASRSFCAAGLAGAGDCRAAVAKVAHPRLAECDASSGSRMQALGAAGALASLPDAELVGVRLGRCPS